MIDIQIVYHAVFSFIFRIKLPSAQEVHPEHIDHPALATKVVSASISHRSS